MFKKKTNNAGGGAVGGKAFPLPLPPTPFRFGSQSFFFLFAVGVALARPSVRPSVPGAPDGGLQEASLDIHPLSVRKLRILFLRTLSR